MTRNANLYDICDQPILEGECLIRRGDIQFVDLINRSIDAPHQYRRISIGLFSFIAALLLAAVGVGELLSGAVPTAVNTLSTDLPVEPVQIPVNSGSEDTDTRVHGWLVRGARAWHGPAGPLDPQQPRGDAEPGAIFE